MKRPYRKPTLVRRTALPAITATVVSGSNPAPSDIRLKEDIRAVGTTVYGLTLYRFRYRGRDGVYEGVMAQEALEAAPDAVIRGDDGYLRVDYAKLGAPFRRVH